MGEAPARVCDRTAGTRERRQRRRREEAGVSGTRGGDMRRREAATRRDACVAILSARRARLALTEQEGRRLRQVSVDRCKHHVAAGLVERLHGGAAGVVADRVVAEQDGDVMNRDEPIALRPAVED